MVPLIPFLFFGFGKINQSVLERLPVDFSNLNT